MCFTVGSSGMLTFGLACWVATATSTLNGPSGTSRGSDLGMQEMTVQSLLAGARAGRKGLHQVANIFSFVGWRASVATTQLCHCR